VSALHGPGNRQGSLGWAAAIAKQFLILTLVFEVLQVVAIEGGHQLYHRLVGVKERQSRAVAAFLCPKVWYTVFPGEPLPVTVKMLEMSNKVGDWTVPMKQHCVLRFEVRIGKPVGYLGHENRSIRTGRCR
jgi:hypothetical protein